ncbi:MAG: pyridine nucleotide-disulfide oxidoreductase [Ignavibacteriae bacterium HGW-Ignavibacteriae-2]|jgi:NADPH-dependent 2,4-dienoyl-CoA reductase/sulfur reductase-like enzyme|nr:MAG: pyridine nucleotide-disulfide oxidoreductase [Ignavibacteriae bacterium HGW-Ignavibacteriae-2]
MKKYDIAIIGGGPAGVTCALSAKNIYPEKNVVLIRKEPKPMIPCGIPYVFHTLNEVSDNILPDTPLIANKIEIINDEAIGRNENKIILQNNGELEFDKLVLATGSKAVLPKIENVDKENVFLIMKDKEYLKNLKTRIQESEKIVILGGGYIGVEVADELLKAKKEVTIVEMMDTLLQSMDKEFGDKVKEILENNGCKIITGKSVDKILGDKKVNAVELNDGSKVDCDLLIISCGYKPNVELAEKFNLVVEEGKGILVDAYLRTSEKDIFAIGDCAAKYDFYTGEFSNIMLASTAMAEGRLVGTNLYSIKVIRQYPGVLGSFSTKIGDTAFAVSGIIEKRAKARSLDYTVGFAKSVDRHPGKLPGASEVTVKLIFSTYSHTLMGAQITGGDSVGEMINIVSVMILNKMTDIDINNLQIGTHPLLTASPVAYPIINATVDAIKKWYKMQAV